MPLYEFQYPSQLPPQPDGKVVTILPSRFIQHVGPVLSVLIMPSLQHVAVVTKAGQKPPDPVQGIALIDTGASVTMVDESICKSMGLQPTGFAPLCHADGKSENRPCFAIQISFPNTPLAEPLFNPKVVSGNLQFGNPKYSLLLGRDLMINMKFVYNGFSGRFEIAL